MGRRIEERGDPPTASPDSGSGFDMASVTDLDEVRRERALRADGNPPGVEADEGTVQEASVRIRKPGNRRFDHEKVARLKAAIAAGEYEIDHESVARRFIEHERNG